MTWCGDGFRCKHLAELKSYTEREERKKERKKEKRKYFYMQSFMEMTMNVDTSTDGIPCNT